MFRNALQKSSRRQLRLKFTNLKFIIPKTGTFVLFLFHMDIFVGITELDTVMPVITVTVGGRCD